MTARRANNAAPRQGRSTPSKGSTRPQMASHSSAVTARLPSSTKRPTSSRRDAVIQAMAVLRLGRQQLRPAAPERHAQQGDGEEPGDEREAQPVARRPNDADPFP